MSFETTVRAFAAALGEPSAPPPAMTHGRMGAPDARRFAVYRNNVAVGLIGALEARYPVSRRIAGDELFRAMARAFVRAHKPRSPVMIAYGGEFPEFVADYLAAAEARPSLRQTALEITDASLRRVSSPLAGEGQGGGRAVLCDKGAATRPIISSASATPHPCPPPQEGAGALTASILPDGIKLLPPSPTSRGSRTPGSRPIMPKTQRGDSRRARLAQSRLSARNADRLSPGGAALALRDARRVRLGLGAGFRPIRSRQLRGLAKTRSSRVPIATSACASCRRSGMISP